MRRKKFRNAERIQTYKMRIRSLKEKSYQLSRDFPEGRDTAMYTWDGLQESQACV